jgi:hypothetical protein
VKQEPSDKLYSGYGNLFCPVFLSIIDFEGHHTVFKHCDATVCKFLKAGFLAYILNVFQVLKLVQKL